MGSLLEVGDFEQDRFGDACCILRHVAVPEADDGPAFVFQPGGAGGVARTVGVVAAVDFDRQSRFAAGEVDDERAFDQLAREGRAEARQQAPQRSFGAGGVGAELAGAAGHFGIDAVHLANVTQGALRAYPPLQPPTRLNLPCREGKFTHPLPPPLQGGDALERHHPWLALWPRH